MVLLVPQISVVSTQVLSDFFIGKVGVIFRQEEDKKKKTLDNFKTQKN